jgi:acetate kinase
MNVLTINCGSSTLKFQLIESGSERRLARGAIERIGGRATVAFAAEGGAAHRGAVSASDHEDAARHVLDRLASAGLREGHGLHAVGHRVVHGGERFTEPTLIDGGVVTAIEALADLAPLHNEPALKAIRACRDVLGPDVPMVATFDTTFYLAMPERASRYAISLDLAARHGVRRYGFHGLAHRYMTERYAALLSTPSERLKLITLQLGNGCSATAVAGGRPVDTSMGLTPLEGLVMGTRSGDVDPSLAGFLARREGAPIDDIEDWLNTRSGLLGVSGRSRDMRELLEAEANGDARASLAVEMFCYRVKKYLGAYLAILDGADAVVFGGGVGENAPPIRARICAGMEWCGLVLDAERNAGAVGCERRISADDSPVQAHVTTVDEEVIIARDTVRCLEERTVG